MSEARSSSSAGEAGAVGVDPLAVGVWGTGNMGRAAIRAVLATPGMSLACVVTSTADKVGRSAGELALVADGSGGDGAVAATLDRDRLLASGCVAVAYTASGDIRPDDALADIEWCLRSGLTVVTPSVYALYDPRSAPEELRNAVAAATAEGNSSLLVTGVDPGWGNDVLPLLASGLAHSITEIRCQEIFDYSTYDQEFAVRELVGMGKSLDEVPPMVIETVPTMVWGGQIRLIARAMGVELDSISETLERLPLEGDVETALGLFRAGTQGAMRFEVIGVVDGRAAIVMEHVTRIHPEVAPDWPQPTSGAGSHRVLVTGDPNIEITVEAETEGGNRAAGGNATAANRLVGAIPWLVANAPGVFDATEVPISPAQGLVGQAE